MSYPASPIIKYQAFVDPSGGKAHSFTLAIGHKSDRAIIDLVRAWLRAESESSFPRNEFILSRIPALPCRNCRGLSRSWPRNGG